MLSSGCNYSKLKTNLRLATARLKQVEKKKTELAQKARKEIADFISGGKYERARIKVEQVIREDYMVEGMEILEMYCELLISRFGLFQETKGLHPNLAEAISTIIWVAPRLESDIPELKIIADQLGTKVGKKHVEACRLDTESSISEKLRHKMGVQPPPKILVEKYLIEIAKNYDIDYEPDPQVMLEEQQSKGIDALLFDNGFGNDLGGEKTRPTGFVGFPQAPLPPMPAPNVQPFHYPSLPAMEPPDSLMQNFLLEDASNTGPPPYGAPFAYNIPPTSSTSVNIPPDPSKKINTASSNVSNVNSNLNDINTNKNQIRPNINSNLNDAGMNKNKQSAVIPKPLPRSKMAPPDDSGLDLNLPNIPSGELPAERPDNADSSNVDDIDFDDLMRRFEDLKKRK